MTAIRYATVVMVGCLAGLLWAVIFVDSIPKWFEDLPVIITTLLLLLPLTVHFLCGMCLDWWRWSAATVYTLIVLALWTVGSIRNELLWAGNLSHMSPASEVVGCVLTATLLIGSWALGCKLRNRRRATLAE